MKSIQCRPNMKEPTLIASLYKHSLHTGMALKADLLPEEEFMVKGKISLKKLRMNIHPVWING